MIVEAKMDSHYRLERPQGRVEVLVKGKKYLLETEPDIPYQSNELFHDAFDMIGNFLGRLKEDDYNRATSNTE